MDFMELVKERYSVRHFSDRAVEKEVLAKIIEAGRWAPTAANFQPQRLLIVKSPDELVKLKECTRFDFKSPLVIILCYDRTVSWKRRYDGHDGGPEDVSIVATLMMLQATELGLGTTWIGSFDPAMVKRAYNLPYHIEPVVILPLGYPAEDSQPNPLHFKRDEMKDKIFMK